MADGARVGRANPYHGIMALAVPQMNPIAAILSKLKAVGCLEMKEAVLLADTVVVLAEQLELYQQITPEDANHFLKNPQGIRYCKDPKCKTGASNTPCYRIRQVMEQIAAKPGEVAV